jgi:uncharacterized protein (TIGR02246 family)
MMQLLVTVLVLLLSCSAPVAADQNLFADEASAIRRSLESYTEVFNKNDAAALSSFWAEDAQYEDETGDLFQGRKQIEEAFKQFFSENKGAKLKIAVSRLHVSSPTRAVVEGTSTVSIPGEEESESDFVAEFSKKENRWQLASVGEDAASPGYQHLKELEWLVGDWVDEGEAGRFEFVAQWTGNRNFITIYFAVRQGGVDVEGTHIIGWDPVKKKIRSWIFDSAGSYATGNWSKKGSQWTLKISRILNDGTKESEINTYNHVNDNAFTWSASSREANGQQLPNLGEIKNIRRKPE